MQGQFFNASQLGLSLGSASHSTTTRCLDIPVDTMIVRNRPPHLVNVGKRLVKSPNVNLPDSGLLQAIATVKDLQGHPTAGRSWEGFGAKQIVATLPPEAQMGFYRTASGAELDVSVYLGTRKIGSEIDFSAAPSPIEASCRPCKI